MTFKIPQLFLTVCGPTRYGCGRPTLPKPGSMNDSKPNFIIFNIPMLNEWMCKMAKAGCSSTNPF